MAAAAGADPADKTKLEEAAKTIDALEFALSDPTQWQSALETVTKVFSYLHVRYVPLYIRLTCAVFQLSLFTSALLIRARVCAQRP